MTHRFLFAWCVVVHAAAFVALPASAQTRPIQIYGWTHGAEAIRHPENYDFEERPWVRSPAIGGQAQRLYKCPDYLRAYADFRPLGAASFITYLTVRGRASACFVLELLHAAAPARESLVADFKLSSRTLSELPAALAVDQTRASADHTSWQDAEPDAKAHVIPHERLQMRAHAWQGFLEFEARADFDGDGYEDLLFLRNYDMLETAGTGFGVFVVSKTPGDAALRVVRTVVNYRYAGRERGTMDLPSLPFETATTVDATCRRVAGAMIPAEDAPQAADRARLADCDAIELQYINAGKAPERDAALCAQVQMERGHFTVLSGPGVLTEAFTNGTGVKRSVDLALRFACEATRTSSKPTERREALVERLPLVSELASGDHAQWPFRFCETVGTSIETYACSLMERRVEDAQLERRIEPALQRGGPALRLAYEDLLSSARLYFQVLVARDEHLYDSLSAGSFASAPEEYRFRYLVDDMLSGERPSNWSEIVRQQSSSKLSEVYAKFAGRKRGVLAALPDDRQQWESYRDAWLAFATLAAPDASHAELNEWLSHWQLEWINKARERLRVFGPRG